MIGKLRLTHRLVTNPAVVVIALYSDVAADYFVESMAADVATEIDRAYGKGTALAVEGFETRVWVQGHPAIGRMKAAPVPADVVARLSRPKL